MLYGTQRINIILCTSPIFGLYTFLDASKAFDRVRYCKLFRLLVSRQVPALIVRVLINCYVGNFVRVQWCGIVSDYVLACNGVKQG